MSPPLDLRGLRGLLLLLRLCLLDPVGVWFWLCCFGLLCGLLCCLFGGLAGSLGVSVSVTSSNLTSVFVSPCGGVHIL